jgi:hypothetical protein
MPHGVVIDPKVFVAIAPGGIVTILAHRPKLGYRRAHQSANDRTEETEATGRA